MSLHLASLRATLFGLLLALTAWLAVATSAAATSLLRDPDMEHGLKQLATPVLKAAGLSPNRVKILVVNAGSLNAFVVSQDAIFIHSGLISKLTTPSQLQAVIAHEAAHIANGHITRRLTNLKAARTAAGLGLALAAAAAAGGAGDAAAGIALGTRSSAQRLFFKHTRAEEASADLAAMRYLRSSDIALTGMLEVMQIFRGQEVLSERRQDPYVRSHPLSRDRVRTVQAQVAVTDAPPEDAQSAYWFARVKGKLTAFQRSPKWTQRRAGESGYSDVKAMRLAVSHHRQSQTKKALQSIDRAIALQPKDPFYQDLKGQILMESRNFQAATKTYARAAALGPRDGLILAGYGRALLATGQTNKALDNLERARSIDYRDGIMLRDLATAYAKVGQRGMAALVTAERYALRGQLSTALIHAKRATDLLPTGSGPWQRAQDVLIAAERAAKSKRNR